MATWNPSQYLRFSDERGRPFVDLVSRISVDAATVVDLGCGPGQLTPVLRARFPESRILGVDSSAEMIERAEAENSDPRARYESAHVGDWQPAEPVDVIVSNALFQWVPDSFGMIERLASHVRSGGAFAIQTPRNFDAASHRLLHELSSAGPYAEHTEGMHEDRGTEGAADYLALFAGLGWSADAWETTYQHVLRGEDPVYEWISGTGARPILQALPDGLRAQFVAEYKAALREAYPRQDHGTVLPFARAFCVAVKP